MKNIQLADDASVWYLLWSNQALLLGTVTILQGLLPFWEGVIPAQWFAVAGAVINSAGFVLRNIKQPKAHARLEAKRGHHDSLAR